MTAPGETNVPYSDLSGQSRPAYTSDFVSVGQPQSQYPQLTQQQYAQQAYPQPAYVIPQQQVIVVEQTQPVVDRHIAIMKRLHGKHCCWFFSYPTGVRIVAAIQIVSWFIWSIAFVEEKMWWLWIFTVLAIIMCYYGFTGARRLDERRLRLYFYYLVLMTVLYLVNIFVFAASGYAVTIAGWVVSLIAMLYWCHVVKDFVRVIHEVDYGTGSFLEDYRHSSHSHDHHHDDN